MTDSPFEIVVDTVTDYEDGSAGITVTMSDQAQASVIELGLQFIFTCAAAKVDIQDALDGILGDKELLWAAENDAKEAEAYAGELEANLKHQANLIEQLFALLEIKEQKDDGRYFHPNIIRSSRALDAEKLETIMAELKRTVTANSKSSGCCR